MLGMDGLLSGNPVLISNGSLFLAFSSWYSFPDLIVLGSKTTHVKFSDNLFPPGGSCTIGREMITDQPEGIRWCTIGLRVACLWLRGHQFREVKAGNTACDGCLQVITRTRDWFGTSENHILGYVDDQGSITQFQILYSVNSKAHVGGHGATVCTEYIDGDHELPYCSEANPPSNSISL